MTQCIICIEITSVESADTKNLLNWMYLLSTALNVVIFQDLIKTITNSKVPTFHSTLMGRNRINT